MTCGVYKLNFPNTAKVYIGQSKYIEERIKSHIAAMKAGISSKKLNDAYITFGTPTIEVLIECTSSELDVIENEAIEVFDSVENGFNSCKKAGGGSSLVGEDRANSIYSNEEIVVALNALLDNYSTPLGIISEMVGVSKSVLNQISTGTKHKWLEKEFPEKYLELLRRKGTKKSFVQCAAAIGISYPEVVDPKGNIYNVTNVSAFSKEHNLDCGNLNRLLNKKAKSHKGWKLKI